MRKTKQLTPNKRKALTAILANKSIRDAAKSCGLHERTLWNYLSDDQFLQALRTEQNKLYAAAGARLAQGITQALDELYTLMTSAESEAVRRQAVTDWLSHALKLKEHIEFDERITALEARMI